MHYVLCICIGWVAVRVYMHVTCTLLDYLVPKESKSRLAALRRKMSNQVLPDKPEDPEVPGFLLAIRHVSENYISVASYTHACAPQCAH